MSDQDVQDKIAALKLKREVLKRLSKLLQENPELRAKTLTSVKGESGVFREVFSEFRNRQLSLANLCKELPLEEEAVAKKLSNVLQGRFIDFSSQTTNAMGNAQIWIPKEASVAQREKLAKAFADISNIAAKMIEIPIDRTKELKSHFEKLEKARERAKDMITHDDIASLNPEYTEIRLSDLKTMEPSMQSNFFLLKHLGKKNYEAFIIQLQRELNAETTDAVFRLSSQLAKLSGISEKADEAIDKLNQIMEIELLSTQEKIMYHKLVPWAKNAIPHQEKAAELIKKGVKLLDFAIVEVVKAQSEIEQPALPEGAEPAKDPSEEAILAALEKELAKLEREARQPEGKMMGLGIAQTFNLRIKNDWEKATKEQKKEMEKKRREMQQASKQQKQQAKKAQRAAAQAQQMASRGGKLITERLHREIAVPWKNRQTQVFDGGVTWNKLSSELRRSLGLYIESDIPEEYREPIEQYFREIAEKNKGE